LIGTYQAISLRVSQPDTIPRVLEKECLRNIEIKKTIKRAFGDVGLIFCAFNLRRIFNILDKNTLKAYLKALAFAFRTRMACFKPKYASLFFHPKYPNLFCVGQLTA